MYNILIKFAQHHVFSSVNVKHLKNTHGNREKIYKNLVTLRVSATWSVNDGETRSSPQEVSSVNCDSVSLRVEIMSSSKGSSAAQQLIANN